MPTCFVTVSEVCAPLDEVALGELRDIIAAALDSKSRRLDRSHIVVRVLRGSRSEMLGEIEIEVFCQFFLRRFFDRDRRAASISRKVSETLGYDCASWINMSVVGYSRVKTSGEAFFSD